jgi:PTH1 family peptidyl-tRNA hydrolase
MRLVVGLGNPGKQYVGTRHNIGWEVLDALAVRFGWIAKSEKFGDQARNNFDGLVLDGTVSIHSGGTEKILLLKPTTYMNLSGQSVQAAMKFYQLSPPEILVVLDDMALPAGKLRIRKGGSSGGHNGLKDIERALGTDEYPRLRVGIDPPPANVPGRDYVLGRFTEEQRRLVDPAVQRAAAAIAAWIEFGIDKAMNTYNTEENEAKN